MTGVSAPTVQAVLLLPMRVNANGAAETASVAPGGLTFVWVGDGGQNATEANVSATAAYAMNAVGLALQVTANTLDTADSVAVLRVNGADTALSANLGTTTGTKTAVGNVAIAAGDVLSVALDGGTGLGSATVKCVWLKVTL